MLYQKNQYDSFEIRKRGHCILQHCQLLRFYGVISRYMSEYINPYPANVENMVRS